jgi:serine O-acetyltransferase
VFFDHAMGVVVGETAVIGDGCTIYQGVTLGGTSLYKGTKRHPTLGCDVVVGAGAKVLGGFTVGDGARIGSNAVVTKPVPAGATAVGNPARIILADAKADNQREAAAQRMGFSAYGVTASDDPISVALRGLIDTCARQEQQILQLSQAIEQLSAGHPPNGQPTASMPSALSETEKLNRLIE